jgi:hypothetical protein
MRKLEKIRIGLHCIGPVKLLMSDLRQPQPYFAGNLEQSARQCAHSLLLYFSLMKSQFLAVLCCAVLREPGEGEIQSTK